MARKLGWAGGALLAAVLALRGVSPAEADDPPPPPPTPVPGEGGEVPAATEPVPDARPRPPEPPPPGAAFPGWDLSTTSRSLGLPPPLPPPDPFAPRPIQFRHDREVSADGRIKELRRVPQWVDVLERREIEEWRPQDLGEMLRRFPNVMIADGGSPFLRLPVIRGLGGDRVRIMTDGVWPDAQALGVAGGTLSLWDPEDTERVEVYHGPGAYLRGAEAGGGVINVVPRRPHRHERFEAWGNASTAYNSADNRFREHLGVDMGSGRVAALLGVTYQDWGDRQTADETLDPSSFQSLAASLALDYFLDNQSTVGITGQFVRAEDIESPIGGGGAFGQPRYERAFLALTFTSFDVGSVFHGTRASIALDTFVQEDDQTDSQALDLSSEDDVKRFDLHFQGNLYLHPCHDTWAELSVGYAHLERTETIERSVTSPPTDGPFVGEVVGPQAVPGGPVFGTTSFEANEWIVKALVEDESHNGCNDLHLGARVDWYHIDDDRTGETTDEVLFGAAGGIAHKVSECTTTFANASYGRRHPSLQELFSVAVLDGITVFGNPDLDPETSVNAEAGVKVAHGNRATLQVAGFGHWIGDYIGRETVGTDEQWGNLGDVLLYGAEATGAYRPDPCRCEGWELFGAAGVTLSNDEDLIRDLPYHGRGGARYSSCREATCGVRRWFVEGTLRGASDATTPLSGGDAYLTADLIGGVGWSRGGRRSGLATLGVTNLFDADYTEPLARLPSQGISVIASLSIEF